MATANVAKVSVAGGYWRVYHYIEGELRSFMTNIHSVQKPSAGSLIEFVPDWRDPERVIIAGVVVYQKRGREIIAA